MRFNREKFFDGIRPFFKENQTILTAKRVKAIDFLLDSFEVSDEWKDIRHIAYALATIMHETAWTFAPITEYGSKSYFNRYDIAYNPKKAKELGNLQAGDGYTYRGRGFVQLTGLTNYRDYKIENNPELALEPDHAFYIMTDGMFKGRYTGKKLSDYINAKKCDYINARRIINGTDKADVIAKYAKRFETILKNSTVVTNLPSAETENASLVQIQTEQQTHLENPLNPTTEGQPLNTETVTVETPQGTSITLDSISNTAEKVGGIADKFAPISNSSKVQSILSQAVGYLLLAWAFFKDYWLYVLIAVALISLGVWLYSRAKDRAVGKQIATFKG